MSGTLPLPGVTWASIGGHTELAATKENLGEPPYFKVGETCSESMRDLTGVIRPRGRTAHPDCTWLRDTQNSALGFRTEYTDINETR